MRRCQTEEILGLDTRQQWDRDRQIVLAQLHNLMLALRSNTKFSSRMRFVQAAMEPQHRLMTLVKNLRELLFSPQTDDEIPESEILTPFCEVALSEETTEPITGVALAAFVTFLDLKCGFLATASLVRLSECASNSKSEIADAQSHEAVLARILQVYVGCTRHPSAEGLDDSHLVGMLEKAYAVSTHGEPTELLRRTAEQAMNDMVTAVFYRIVDDCHKHEHEWIVQQEQESQASGAPASVPLITSVPPKALSSPQDPSPSSPTSDRMMLCGARIIQYICKLIMCHVTLPRAPPGQSAVSMAAVQLQGLCLAHTALFILKDLLRLPHCLPLLRVVRNDLCRALLTVGTRTENIIVLSQLLRTAHLVVQFASVSVVPQALSIIKGIHLTPMMSLTPSSLAATPAAGGSGVSGGGGIGTPLSIAANVEARSPIIKNGSGSGSAPSFSAVSAPINATLDDLEAREAHEMLVESLLEFCSDRSFATFCFVHFDLSLHYPPLLEQLTQFLSRNCFHSGLSTTGAGGAAPSGLRGAGAAGGQSHAPLNQINLLAFDSLMGMLTALAERVHQQQGATRKPHHGLVREAVMTKLSHKRYIMEFAEKFAAEPLKEGIAYYWVTQNAASRGLTGWDVGQFLFNHRAMLDKTVLGEYLGDLGREPTKPDSADVEAVTKWESERVDDHRKPGTVRFQERQLRGFMSGFAFSGKDLLQSIREMVFQMRLPGESQKIDRVMQAFAEQWYMDNKNLTNAAVNPFQSEDAAFILSFSIIMLNTDLHSGKMDRTMTKEQFRSMNRGIDNGQNVPDEYLNAVFDAVKAEQIIMIDMVRQGHEYDAVWKMEMAEARQQQHDSLLAVGMRGNSAPDLHPFDPFVFQTLWKPTLLGLAAVFEGCSATFSLDKTVRNVEQMKVHLKKRWPRDTANFLCAFKGLRTIAELGSLLDCGEAVDHCLATLLAHAPLSLHNGYSSLQMLGRSASTLMALCGVFEVFFEHHASLRASWGEYADFLIKAFLLGLFSTNWGLAEEPSNRAEDAATGGAVVAESSMASSRTYSEVVRDDDAFTASSTLSAVLRSNPGLIGPQSALLHLQSESSGGTWLGSWFGGGSSQQATKRKEREAEDIATLRRIKSTIPDIQAIVDASKALEDAGFTGLVVALCSCRAANDVAHASGGFAASYAMHFTLELVVNNIRRIELVETAVLEYVQTVLRGAAEQLELSAPHPGTPTSAAVASTAGSPAPSKPQPSPSSPSTTAGRAMATYDHWKVVTARMVDAVLRLVAALAHAPKHHLVMVHLLSILTRMPHSVLSSVVAQPLSVMLYQCMIDRPASEGTFQASADVWNQLIYTAHMVGVVAPYMEVRARMLAVLLAIVREGSYHVLENSQRLAHGLLSNVLAPAVAASEVPQDWMSITSFDTTPYVTVQTPQRQTKEVDMKEQEERVSEALTVVYKRIVLLCREGNPLGTGDGGKWHDAWMFILSGLVTLVVSARQQRVSSDALLCLQRCILDPDLLTLPLSAVLEMFYDLVFPITEKLCSSALPEGAASRSDSSVATHSSFLLTPSRGGPTDALSLLSPSVLMSAVFGPLAGPAVRHAASSTGGASSNGTPSPGSSNVPHHVNDEMQCRAVSLLPKTFLHYLYILANAKNASPPPPSAAAGKEAAALGPLEDLWRRIMGTLYALYSANSVKGHHGRGDDHGMLREAIQENVKNLVFVMSSTVLVPEHRHLLSGYPHFWTLTNELVKAFDFGEVLTKHLAACKLL